MQKKLIPTHGSSGKELFKFIKCLNGLIFGLLVVLYDLVVGFVNSKYIDQ
jgi:hypothetical protein